MTLVPFLPTVLNSSEGEFGATVHSTLADVISLSSLSTTVAFNSAYCPGERLISDLLSVTRVGTWRVGACRFVAAVVASVTNNRSSIDSIARVRHGNVMGESFQRD